MTDTRGGETEAPEIIREIFRRAGHEIRNALSGAAVNVEVVRSRIGRLGVEQDTAAFADRAAAQIGEASSLSDGLLALAGSVIASQAAGRAKATSGHGAGSRFELMIYGEAEGVVSNIERLASRIGVAIEQNGQNVILTILPEGKSHSKD